MLWTEAQANRTKQVDSQASTNMAVMPGLGKYDVPHSHSISSSDPNTDNSQLTCPSSQTILFFSPWRQPDFKPPAERKSFVLSVAAQAYFYVSLVSIIGITY